MSSHDPYATPKAVNNTQNVSTSTMIFGESDESYDNDHKKAGCCACSANISNIIYGLILIIGTAAAWGAKYITQSVGAWSKFCTADLNPILKNICIKDQTVYRISFVLAVFFLLMTFITFCSRKFHYESWIFKGSIISGLFTASMFIPGTFFLTYREIARWSSFLFIVMQVLVLVDFAHCIHENILKHMDGDEDNSNSKKARIIYLALSLTALITFITGIIILFVKYNPCSLHAGMISVTLILGVGAILLSLVESVGKGLLPPTLLAVYCTLITYQALTTNTTETCSTSTTATMPTWLIVLSFLTAILQVGWSSVRAAHSNRLFLDSSIKTYSQSSTLSRSDQSLSSNNNPYSDTGIDTESGYKAMETSGPNWDTGLKRRNGGGGGGGGGSGGSGSGSDEDLEEANPPRHWIFHLTLTTCAMYVAMMLTGWGSATDTSIANPEASLASFWIKMVSVWASFGLYLWTLVAPILFPNRDFSSA